MKANISFFRIYHLLMILCIVLPFTNIQCSPNAEEQAREQAKLDSLKADSIKKLDVLTLKLSSKEEALQFSQRQDSMARDSVMKSDSIAAIELHKADSIEARNNSLSFWKNILRRALGSDSKLSALGIMVLYFNLKALGLINSFFSLFFILIYLFLYRTPKLKNLLLFDIVGLAFLSCALEPGLLWGFWIFYLMWCVSISALIVLIFQNNKKRKEAGLIP